MFRNNRISNEENPSSKSNIDNVSSKKVKEIKYCKQKKVLTTASVSSISSLPVLHLSSGFQSRFLSLTKFFESFFRFWNFTRLLSNQCNFEGGGDARFHNIHNLLDRISVSQQDYNLYISITTLIWNCTPRKMSKSSKLTSFNARSMPTLTFRVSCEHGIEFQIMLLVLLADCWS